MSWAAWRCSSYEMSVKTWQIPLPPPEAANELKDCRNVKKKTWLKMALDKSLWVQKPAFSRQEDGRTLALAGFQWILPGVECNFLWSVLPQWPQQWLRSSFKVWSTSYALAGPLDQSSLDQSMHLAAGYVQNWSKERNHMWTDVPAHKRSTSLIES